jgi:DNA-binding transcriptional LysR family regulator
LEIANGMAIYSGKACADLAHYRPCTPIQKQRVFILKWSKWCSVIDVRLLLQFAAVAECLSFTQAAARLSMGQPRLSTQIRKLEDQLGASLFQRSTRRVELTSRGRDLLKIVEPLAAAAALAGERVDVLRKETRSVVRIGCPQLGAPDSMQARLFAVFLSDNPALSLDVHPGLSGHQADQLRQGELDLALMSVLPAGIDWDVLPLHRLALAAILHQSDPLAATDAGVALAPELFRGRRIAVFHRRRAPDLFESIYNSLAVAGAELVEVPELRRSLLRDRPGLVLSTIIAVPAAAELSHGLVRREISIPFELRMKLVRLSNAIHSPAAERFWKMAGKV